ncbi:MAG: DNA polymerase I, partial [Lachnospiraceae bacterium]|nr:DNA polymerase I [Lachnospiraceae bacterium]
SLAGKEFNINSTKQLGEILFEDLGLKSGKKTKTGYSTSVEVLEKIKGEHEIIPKILEYRQLTKLNSTYVEGLSVYIKPDGRIHGKFNQTVTATGRLSSTEPNLQNIPTRLPLGREIRKVFIPEDGYVFLDADYSQIELRVLAHLSKDEALISAYKKDTDIHTATASEVFGVPIEEVDSLMRRKAKAVNFGIVYGISSFGLGQDLDIPRKEAEGYINKYFETYKNVKGFLDEIVNSAKEKGYSITMFNRRRPIPELKSSNFMTRSFGERCAMNSPVQGTAADIIKIAMINVNNELKSRNLKSRLILQVHDELLIETKEEELEEVKSILNDNMMKAAELSVPLIVDMHEGKSWYDAK